MKGDPSLCSYHFCGSLPSIARFGQIIRACSLQHDLDMLPEGQHTEIGEKGINLSGKSLHISCNIKLADLHISSRWTEGMHESKRFLLPVHSHLFFKARISLARAAYSDASIVLLDDPLAAVDAYVGKAILDQCLVNGPLSHRTRILVTHALHVLDQTDYIYVVEKGIITAQGTFKASPMKGLRNLLTETSIQTIGVDQIQPRLC